MNIFQSLFNVLLTELVGSASFHIGNFEVGISTVSGNPAVVVTLVPHVNPPSVNPISVPMASAAAKSTSTL